MSRDVWTVNLFPRENVHVQPSPWRDVRELVLGATALFLWMVVAILVLM